MTDRVSDHENGSKTLIDVKINWFWDELKIYFPACFLSQSPPNMFVMNGSKKPVIFADLGEIAFAGLVNCFIDRNGVQQVFYLALLLLRSL